MDDNLSNERDYKLHAVVFLINAYSDTRLPPDWVRACGTWYFNLTEPEKLVAIQAVQAFNSGDKDKALQIVSTLPPVQKL